MAWQDALRNLEGSLRNQRENTVRKSLEKIVARYIWGLSWHFLVGELLIFFIIGTRNFVKSKAGR